MSDYSDILDNRQFYVEDRANQLAEGSKEVKIAVGYFYVSGFDLLRENLQDAEKVELVIGRQTDAQTKKELVRGFQEDLDKVEKNEDSKEGINRLYRLIHEDKVDVKIYTKSRFHPKLYLFNYDDEKIPGASIIGSSNLSPSGLKGNVELNVEKKDSPSIRYLNNWFDEIWEESQEFKEKLIDVIESSKFEDTLPSEEELKREKEIPDNIVSPFTATKLYIYEEFTEEVNEETLFEEITGEYEEKLTEFQNDAVRDAHYPLNKYNGVILSDSVGLGKSYIGAPLVEDYSNPQSRVLVITPKRLQDMWKRLLNNEFNVRGKKRFMSFGELSILDDPNEINRLRDYDIILIDEAHKLRNTNTKRYDTIQSIGRKDKKYILLTATPIQNSVTDLDSLIKVFADDDDFTIDLKKKPSKLFKKYDRLSDQEEIDRSDRKDLKQLRQEIKKVMQEVLISRSREYILQNYDNITINGKEIKAPERVPELVSLEDAETEDLYRNIIDIVVGEEDDDETGLNLPYVSVDRYSRTEGEEELFIEYRNAGTLLTILLIKRLESSLSAFEESIERLIRREKITRKIAEGNFEPSQNREEIVEYFESTDDEGVLDDVNIDQVVEAVDSLGQKQRKEIGNDVTEDLIGLRKMRRQARNVLQQKGEDAKAQRLEKLLKEELSGEKTLLFSQYIPTVEHIFEELTGLDSENNQTGKVYLNGEEKRIGYIHGDKFNSSLVEQFAPEAQEVEVGFEEELDVLISTDVISEGQNLQDSRVVVNYDLHWNPMNMEQRIGRVDRITTKYDRLFIYNFIPTEDLEDTLGILKKLRNKIEDIAKTFGQESPILEDTESLVEKNITIYDRIEEGDIDFKEEDFLAVPSKYDRLRNAVREFCDKQGVSIDDLKQVDALRDKTRTAFNTEVDVENISEEQAEKAFGVLANLEFTSGRTETRAMIINELGKVGSIDLGGQTKFTKIPILEDDDIEVFDTIKSQNPKKEFDQEGLEGVETVKEAVDTPSDWNNKILEVSKSSSDNLPRIYEFTQEMSESDELDEALRSKAEKIYETLGEYSLSDYFENELDKIYRKRNRSSWGERRTIEELYSKINEFEIVESERVNEVDIVLVEELS